MSAPVLPFHRPKRRERSAPPVPDAPVYRDDAPPPGTEIHRGQSTEGAFIVEVTTVDGEIDGELLEAIVAYTARVDERRRRALAAASQRPPRARGPLTLES